MTIDVVLFVNVTQSGEVHASRRTSRLLADPGIARRRRRPGPRSRKDKSKAFLDHRCEGAIVGGRLLARPAKEIFGKADSGTLSHTR